MVTSHDLISLGGLSGFISNSIFFLFSLGSFNGVSKLNFCYVMARLNLL